MISCLVLEYHLLKRENSQKEIRKLWIIDGIYGFSSITTLAAGFTLWFWVGRPASFYNESVLIWGKIGVFLIVGILSAAPTRFFFRHRSKNKIENALIEVPGQLKKYVLVEIILLFLIPIMSVFMAQGFGHF